MKPKINEILRGPLGPLSQTKQSLCNENSSVGTSSLGTSSLGNSPIGNLASELVLCIADFLPTAADISSFSRVNRALHKILFDYLLTFNIKYNHSLALAYAAKYNRISLAQNLLRLGAEVETTAFSQSPLTWAAASGNLKIVEILLEAGVCVEQHDTCHNKYPRYVTAYKRHCQNPLACAIINNFDDIALLLLSHIEDVNAKSCPLSGGILDLAAKYGRVKVVRKLLEKGANPNPMRPPKQIMPLQSVLIETSTSNHDVVQMVLLLLEYGADPELPKSPDERFEFTPPSRQLGEHHRDPRIRAIFSKGQPPLMIMGALETSGPWLSLITNEEETVLWVSDDDGEDYDLNMFKIDDERRLLVLEKPFPKLKRSEELRVRKALKRAEDNTA